MQNVALPKNIEYQESKDINKGKIIIDPCYPGYGITLGNALRRVLLSSLPGAAPVGVKIKGVDHEFSTIPYLKEDLLEFILNLKQIRLKVFSEETVKLELDVHGEKEIKAGDIKKNSFIEIVNPELVLGHITDMSGSLNAEIFVSQGMGYEVIESREKNESELGYIDIDSIFSPVLAVGINVENVRVGKMTNWDKLILNITTDGTITSEEAFKQAVTILMEQFSALSGEKKVNIQTDEIISAGTVIKEEEKDIEKKDDSEKIEESIEKIEEEEPVEPPKRKRGRPRKTDK
ncbi:DNA-directed RNA polymerase subunit alpha [Patescibacteria group bacterium]